MTTSLFHINKTTKVSTLKFIKVAYQMTGCMSPMAKLHGSEDMTSSILAQSIENPINIKSRDRLITTLNLTQWKYTHATNDDHQK